MRYLSVAGNFKICLNIFSTDVERFTQKKQLLISYDVELRILV